MWMVQLEPMYYFQVSTQSQYQCKELMLTLSVNTRLLHWLSILFKQEVREATPLTPSLLALMTNSAVNLHGQYSQCYFDHRHLNNTCCNQAKSLIGKLYLAIIASNDS